VGLDKAIDKNRRLPKCLFDLASVLDGVFNASTPSEYFSNCKAKK